jgi:hypothetical protein
MAERRSPSADAAPLMTTLWSQAVQAGAVQDAVARILADPEPFALLAGQQVALGERYGLTDGQAAALAAVSPAAIERFRRVLRLKRLSMAESLLPVTAGVLRSGHSAASLAADFWRVRPPVGADSANEEFREKIVCDLLGYVTDSQPAQRPDWLPDLARYEAMRALLRCRQPAVEVYLPVPAAGLADDADLYDVVVCRVPGVVLDSFGYDVMTLLPALAAAGNAAHPDPAQCSCHVVAWRRPRGPVQAWRLGPLAFEALAVCGTAMAVRDIAATVGTPQAPSAHTPSPRVGEGTITVIRHALAVGIVRVTGIAGATNITGIAGRTGGVAAFGGPR